ncbi:ATP-binding protein [Leptolyngbya sp. FACHB-321]|uniref:ATP-binding protein n=1 Tax=Leptolyngbya sp. FACHB-321 TaxID=2692807 RepID=UPI001682FEED|nr:ATP-binding protein [Leptolyngbya sp. FACHB-321]MBD2034099.1 ATP-binding protein [Leptolyngbya sp. FACHB-321]
MTEQWQRQNEQYLASAIAWVRQVLERQAGIVSEEDVPTLTAESLEVAADGEFVPALVLLSQRFDLSPFEQSLLLLCVALELDTQIASLCAKAQDNLQRPYPTFALALTLFDEPDWSVVMAEGTLRHWQLIEVTQNATTPLTVSPLRADMRVVHYLKGTNSLDDRLVALVNPLPDHPLAELPPSQQATVDEIIRVLKQSQQRPGPFPIIQLLGTDTATSQLIAQSTADQLGLQLYRLPLEPLPTQMNELTTLARLWHRETLLLPVALYLDGTDIEPKSTQANALKYLISHCNGICFLNSPDKGITFDRPTRTFEVAKPTPPEQRHTWQTLLGPDSEAIATQLASQFRLNTADILDIAMGQRAKGRGQRAEETSPTPPAPLLPHSPTPLWTTCLAKTRPHLDNLAQRIDAKATWDDIVLPEEEMALLHQIGDQVRQRNRVYDDWGFRDKMNRGLGVNAMFAGESGTGKTMAAEVIANDLHLHLYRIDLSAVVSKYIGETEKNLRKLFDAAEDGGAILFFDEADALFGKRSEVKDSHDRYANIEINYLLQRIEAYRGLAILATNLRSSLDTAFLRRLRFIVTFPLPGKAERHKLWEKVFPAQTPVAELDYRRLARLNVTGGNIHTIAINAAFLAAREQAAVGMEHVLTAARGEYRKLERPINEEDFRL